MILKALLSSKIFRTYKILSAFQQHHDHHLMLTAKQLVFEIKRNAGKMNSLHDAEFSVFSQWGDDGIIQYLIHTLNIKEKSFIEFGVENYREANTRFLLMNDNWKGLVMDGSESHISFIKKDSISWKYDLQSVCAFITKENINTLISDAGFNGELGILHIDVDGNDYWFWDCLTGINPQIVIMEYNSAFGRDAAITIPYQGDFVASQAHYSRVYFGSSLKALKMLADKKGYSLVGCNSNGNNAYFVRNDMLNGMKPLSVDEAYVANRFRQNRDENGGLTFRNDADVIKKACGKLPVYDVENNRTVKLEEVL